jgi:hypothetical protein
MINVIAEDDSSETSDSVPNLKLGYGRPYSRHDTTAITSEDCGKLGDWPSKVLDFPLQVLAVSIARSRNIQTLREFHGLLFGSSETFKAGITTREISEQGR